MSKKKGVRLGLTDFPLYTIRVLGDRHLMVAGGGGQAKTGIPNAIEIYEFRAGENSCTAAKVCHHQIEKSAIMNSDVFSEGKDHILAAGLDDSCQIYTLRYRVVTPKQDGEVVDHALRKRKGNLTQSEDHNSVTKVITFDVSPEESVKTDFGKDGGFQKVVKFSSDKSLIVTAGSDGHFRVWRYPDLEMLYDIEAHSNEIDDLDIHPLGGKIATVSRDKKSFIWNTKDGSKHCELAWTHPNSSKYRTRHCVFTTVIDKKNTHSLFTTHIPIVRSSNPDPCYITKWDTSKFVPSKVMATGKEILSAFTASQDGIYLGVGMISGSIAVYIAFSLQKLYYVKEAHNIFVTDLAFTNTSENARSILGDYDFSLLSIGADNQIKLYQQEPRSMWSPVWVLFFIVLIYLFFWFISAYGM